MGTIFEDVKDSLGVSFEDKAFDGQLTMMLQTTSAFLQQLGVTDEYFDMSGDCSWGDLAVKANHTGKENFMLIKTYVYFYIHLAFDPPTGSVLTYQKEAIEELKWRIREAYTGNYLAPEKKEDEDDDT